MSKRKLEQELTQNAKRRKVLTEKEERLQSQLAAIKEEKSSLTSRAQDIQDELDYDGFEWLVPVREKDFDDVEKQYNQWCANICKSFKKKWPQVRTRMFRFLRLHFEYGWKRILMDLLNWKLSSDIVGVISVFVDDGDPLENALHGSIFEQHKGSWQEALQAMYWLWHPDFHKPHEPIKVERDFIDIVDGMGNHQCTIKYDIDWECQDPKCECYDPVCEKGDCKEVLISLNEYDHVYENKGDMDDEMEMLLKLFKHGADDACSSSWANLMVEAGEEHVREQAIPALFLLYFAPQIGWYDDLVGQEDVVL